MGELLNVLQAASGRIKNLVCGHIQAAVNTENAAFSPRAPVSSGF
jgi:hypothetical protein